MTKKPHDMIEEYLDRVRVYLPLNSDDTLIELRTHILEEAERIGEGKLTPGSALMAIERMGDPKKVASEWAGTGETVGPVPKEYVPPIFRILFVLVSISLAFIVGGYAVGIIYGEYLGSIGVINYPFTIVAMIIINIVFVVLIIGSISAITDRDKLATERTTLEGIMGVGSDALKPKSRFDALGETIFSFLFGVVLLLPLVQLAFHTEFIPFLNILALLVLTGGVKGLMFLYRGENTLNLLFEALLSVGWLFLAMFLVNFLFPLENVWVYSGTQWEIISVAEIASYFPEEFPFIAPLAFGWAVFVFIIVVDNIWKILSASIKVSMYFKEDKGLWWKGKWGDGRWSKAFFDRLSRNRSQ